jgi:hypothetical protein
MRRTALKPKVAKLPATMSCGAWTTSLSVVTGHVERWDAGSRTGPPELTPFLSERGVEWCRAVAETIRGEIGGAMSGRVTVEATYDGLCRLRALLAAYGFRGVAAELAGAISEAEARQDAPRPDPKREATEKAAVREALERLRAEGEL